MNDQTVPYGRRLEPPKTFENGTKITGAALLSPEKKAELLETLETCLTEINEHNREHRHTTSIKIIDSITSLINHVRES